MVDDDDCYRSQNADHLVRLVRAKAPGVICLLPPRHQADEDQVSQGQVHDDDGNGQQDQLYPSSG